MELLEDGWRSYVIETHCVPFLLEARMTEDEQWQIRSFRIYTEQTLEG
jgi:hypothetical protein